jgi:hypothetical protein
MSGSKENRTNSFVIDLGQHKDKLDKIGVHAACSGCGLVEVRPVIELLSALYVLVQVPAPDHRQRVLLFTCDVCEGSSTRKN